MTLINNQIASSRFLGGDDLRIRRCRIPDKKKDFQTILLKMLQIIFELKNMLVNLYTKQEAHSDVYSLHLPRRKLAKTAFRSVSCS